MSTSCAQGRIERLGIAHLLADQFDLECRLVVGEHHAVAVEDQPAAGRDGLGADAVALREGRVIIVLAAPADRTAAEPTSISNKAARSPATMLRTANRRFSAK